MAKTTKRCHLIWDDDGVLACSVQHHNHKNCELYKELGEEVENV